MFIWKQFIYCYERILKKVTIMQFYSDERTALFIDGANLFASLRALKFEIDYKRLLKFFNTRCRIVRAFYYTALTEDHENSPLRPLIDWLEYNGFTLVTKPTKESLNSDGQRRIKGNMDIELAIDMLELAKKLDHIILFSGDGDFRRLVNAVQNKGPRVTVISTIKSSPPMLADELRRQADSFIDLVSLQQEIERVTDSDKSGMSKNDNFYPDSSPRIGLNSPHKKTIE